MSADSTVLYDAPGPRARTRNRLLAIAFIAVLAAIAINVIAVLAANEQFTAEKWSPFVTWSTWTGSSGRTSWHRPPWGSGARRPCPKSR